ncbi:peptide chain release factor N(5)-glutamine methyltransferase [Undibacterium sp.]|jgi:release factor glutamine methyltransferase|uniref:peptide chain release factor N(5)-glutamine methyltransferase n=1 Tax=Undibacterium sp. TaxID=1914977 RepID=UPI002C270B35|nr:peptide chain release factor N(5)-glutamine methyltransferase [Undibacterium sp.]HTD06771.1 peptide chain release factor N(5)-glutamine methyltransferase [Undibacterium sp.]
MAPGTPSAGGTTIAACEASSPLDKLETRILLMHALGLTRIQLITQSDLELDAGQIASLQSLIQRRINGEPIAYITGEREFFGLSFQVTPDVLIPRADTELLVELALQYAPQHGSLLDMGTGSGAIAIAVAHQRPDLQVTALDVSPAALQIAGQNAQRILSPMRLQLLQSDWYDALHDRQFDTIVSNPPYIVKDDQHLSQGDLRFEPVNALTDHADGLSAYRSIIGGAGAHLQQGGWLLMEHGYDQAEAVRKLLTKHGYGQVQSWRDLAGIERVSGGILAA